MKKLALLFFMFVGCAPKNDAQLEQLIRRPRPSPKPVPKQTLNHIGGPEYDGHRITVNLPTDQLLRNKTGIPIWPFRMGSGLCVFTSIDECARWQNVYQLVGFRDYMTQYPGGGTPSKVDRMIAQWRPGVKFDYINDATGNADLLKSILTSGRAAAVSYGYSPRYISMDNLDGEIAHMVTCVLFDDKYMAFLDSNFPFPDQYEWVLVEEGLRRWKLNDEGWVFAFLNPPPPPSPQ